MRDFSVYVIKKKKIDDGDIYHYYHTAGFWVTFMYATLFDDLQTALCNCPKGCDVIHLSVKEVGIVNKKSKLLFWEEK